ncbi:MAG: DUF3987 domain-containing protein, partial [Candidatus Obscuribacterales bacterium]|nr:DUF3987 domain-containing protein [Candidatus Obscuribacterales bacterium]
AAVETADWHEPLLFDKPQTPNLPCSLLPGLLGEFAAAVAAETQTPEGLSVLLALSAVATCVQKRATIKPYGDGYGEPLNIWTVTVLPPASRKTAVFEPFTRPLSEWERERLEAVQSEIQAFEINETINKQQLEQLGREAAKSRDEKEKTALVSEAAKVKQKLAAPRPVAPRLWTSDITAEQLQNLLAEQSERLSVLSDEGGIFEVMTGLYNDGRANMDVFLQSHAGQSLRVDRGHRTVILQNPALTFGIAIQPAVLNEMGGDKKKRLLRGNGTLARFLYCIPVSNIGMRDLRRRASMPAEIQLRYNAFIRHLLVNRDAFQDPRTLQLDPEALELWLGFSEEIERRQGPGGDLESIQDWSGKLPGASLRIAGLMHVAKTDLESFSVDADTLARSIRLASLLAEHAKAALGTLSIDRTIDDAKYVFDWLLNSRKTVATQRELHRLARFRNGKLERVLNAMEVLQERHIVGQKEKTFGRTKPSFSFPVNPAILAEAK